MTWVLTWREHSKGHTERKFSGFCDAVECLKNLVDYGQYKDFQLQEIPDAK